MEEEEDSVYSSGYIRATGCASYTIALDDDNQNGYQHNPGVSMVGQETFLFFEYTLPHSNVTDDDGTNDDSTNDDDDANRRNPEENDENGENQNQDYNNNYSDDGSYESYNYYGSNTILAKDWLVAFSNGALNSGCVELEDDIGVFQDVVPGIMDGSLSFSTLYYGPICSSDSSGGNSKNKTPTVFEVGVFLDPSCNAYVPGLSQILNQVILLDWTTGVSFRGKNNDHQDDHGAISYSYSRYYGTHGDLKYLDSYDSLINQLNHFYNRETTNCENDPQICQDVTEASVDLNTCQSLSSELWEVENGNYEVENGNYEYNNYNENKNEESANEYGEFFQTEMFSNSSNVITDTDKDEKDKDDEVEVSYEDHYRVFQHVLKDYSSCVSTPSNNDGCAGWSYGWGNYDCNVANDDGTNGYYNSDSNCQQGVCYAVLESSMNGYSVSEWLASNTAILEYEIASVYRLEKVSTTFWYKLLAICIIMMALLVALAYWTEGILRSFSQRKCSRKVSQKKEPFLDKNSKTNYNNSGSTGTVDSSLDTPNNSPERYNKMPISILLELTPTMSNISFLQSSQKRKTKRTEVIGHSRGKDHLSIGIV